MKIEIESTTKIVELNGVPARIWQGKTASGIPVHCYVTMIDVRRDKDMEEFDRELMECRVPDEEIEAIPLRMIL